MSRILPLNTIFSSTNRVQSVQPNSHAIDTMRREVFLCNISLRNVRVAFPKLARSLCLVFVDASLSLTIFMSLHYISHVPSIFSNE